MQERSEKDAAKTDPNSGLDPISIQRMTKNQIVRQLDRPEQDEKSGDDPDGASQLTVKFSSWHFVEPGIPKTAVHQKQRFTPIPAQSPAQTDTQTP
jgi:hypothetical protein